MLRGSIQHRVQAVDWHFVILKAQHERAEEEHLGRLKKNKEWDHLLDLLNRKYFLFDDVVF